MTELNLEEMTQEDQKRNTQGANINTLKTTCATTGVTEFKANQQIKLRTEGSK